MSPYLFQVPDWLPVVGGRPIFSYGVMMGLSFILGWSLNVHLSRRDGIDGRIASTAMFVIVISSLTGGRLLHFMSSPTAKFSIANFFKFDEGGLVAYGGFIGGLAGCWLYMKWRDVDGWVYWDNCAAPLALGLGITRIGCLLFGCDYGVKSQGYLALTYPRWDDPGVLTWIRRDSPAFTDHYRNVIDNVAQYSHSVHPTQLYESLVGFVAFGVLLLWQQKRKYFHGQIMLMLMGFYSIARYLIEMLRGDADRGENVVVWLSTSQLTSVLVLGIVAALWWYLSPRGLYAASGTTRWSTNETSSVSGRRKPKKRKGRK